MISLLIEVVLTYWYGPRASICMNEHEVTFRRLDPWKLNDLWACASLVVREYSKLGYMKNSVYSKLKIFLCYLYRRQTVFLAEQNGNLLATVSLIPDRGLLPSKSSFQKWQLAVVWEECLRSGTLLGILILAKEKK